MRVVDIYNCFHRLSADGKLDELCANLSKGRRDLYKELRSLGLGNVDAELTNFLLMSAFSKTQPGLWSPFRAAYSVLADFMLRTVLPGTRPVLWFGEASWVEGISSLSRWRSFVNVQSVPPCPIPDRGPISSVIGVTELLQQNLPSSTIETFVRATVEKRAVGGIELLIAVPAAIADGISKTLPEELRLQGHSSISRIRGTDGREFEVSLLCGS